jgi:DNA-binding PadR family transcriptional regulator
MSEVRMTLQTRLILRAFLRARLQDASAELYGAEICQETDLGPGTVYPIVTKLLKFGWLEARWEEDEDGALDRPRRHYYRLTDGGAASAQAEVASADARRRKSTKAVGNKLPEVGY